MHKHNVLPKSGTAVRVSAHGLGLYEPECGVSYIDADAGFSVTATAAYLRREPI